MNCVSTEETSASPTESPAPTPTNVKTPKPSLVPPLVQQEIKKVKTLQERIGQTDMSSKGSQNIGENQRIGTTSDQVKQNRSAELKNRRMEQIKRYTKNVAERFRALLTREHQIKNRIQTRIEKLEENGFDMSPAKQLLLETDISFETIKTKIEALKNREQIGKNQRKMNEMIYAMIKLTKDKFGYNLNELKKEINKLTIDYKLTDNYIPRFIVKMVRALRDNKYDWEMEALEDNGDDEE